MFLLISQRHGLQHVLLVQAQLIHIRGGHPAVQGEVPHGIGLHRVQHGPRLGGTRELSRQQVHVPAGQAQAQALDGVPSRSGLRAWLGEAKPKLSAGSKSRRRDINYNQGPRWPAQVTGRFRP